MKFFSTCKNGNKWAPNAADDKLNLYETNFSGSKNFAKIEIFIFLPKKSKDMNPIRENEKREDQSIFEGSIFEAFWVIKILFGAVLLDTFLLKVGSSGWR